MYGVILEVYKLYFNALFQMNDLNFINWSLEPDFCESALHLL